MQWTCLLRLKSIIRAIINEPRQTDREKSYLMIHLKTFKNMSTTYCNNKIQQL
jgi:hypothetical protein